MWKADSGSLQAGRIKAGLLQRVLSEAQARKVTQKILKRFDYYLINLFLPDCTLNRGKGDTGLVSCPASS
jgi:hypothetical protein